MRRYLAVALTCGIALGALQAAPTATEQAAYDAVVQSVVDAINAHRAGLASPQPPVKAVTQLCRGARESAEYTTLGVGVSDTVFNRALAAGYTGLFVSGPAFTAAGHQTPAGLLAFALGNPSYEAVVEAADAASVGVGIAMKADGNDTEIRIFVVFGKLNGGSLGGTEGIESGSGRGLVDLTQIDAILAGAYTGDSIDGFVYDPDALVFTTTVVNKFNNALKKLFKKPPVIAVSVGKPVAYKLPPDVLKLIGKLKIKGKLPPGVTFDAKHGRFRGSPKAPGSYTVRLTGTLKVAVNGSTKLQPIKVKFKVGG